MSIIMGLDISTRTGVAVLTNGELTHTSLVHYKPPAPEEAEKRSASSRFLRYDSYRAALQRLLVAHSPDVVYVEGYGYANQHSLATLVEVGTLLRFLLHQLSVPWLEVPPSSLKKFVTGSGNAKKDLMLLEVYRRFGAQCSDDNIADAVALAYFGAAHRGEYGKLPKDQLLVALSLSTAKPKKKKSVAKSI